MFRISLTLFKCVLSKPEQLAECPSMFETVEKLRKLPPEILEQDFLIREVNMLPLIKSFIVRRLGLLYRGILISVSASYDCYLKILLYKDNEKS